MDSDQYFSTPSQRRRYYETAARYMNAVLVGFLLSNPGFVTMLNDVFDWYSQATHDLLISEGAPHVSSDIQFELMRKRVTEFLRALCIHSVLAKVTSIHVEVSMRSHVHVSPPRQIRIDGRPKLVWKAEVHEFLHLVVRRGIQIGHGEELSSGAYECSHRCFISSDAGDEAGAEDDAAEDEAIQDLQNFIGDPFNFRDLLSIMEDEVGSGRGRGEGAARGRGGSGDEAARGGSDEDSIYEDAAADDLAPVSPDHEVS